MTLSPQAGAPQPGVLAWVVSQHAEEAAFQWLLRENAAQAPHYSLVDLAGLDDTVTAHLDGLFLAQEAGWKICRSELDWAEPGELFAASVLAFSSGQAEHIETVVDAAVATDDASTGLASALGWLPYDLARPHVEQLLLSDEPRLRALGLGATALHRQDPGDCLQADLNQFNELVTPRALRTAGEMGRQDVLSLCRQHIDSEHGETAFWAAWSTTVLGDKTAAERLGQMATIGGVRAETACAIAARTLAPQRALEWQQELAADTAQMRLAIIAAGACGDPQLIPWLIEAMSADEHARIAGESLGFITGADLAYLELERDCPEGFESGPNEDPADDEVELDLDEDLAWPAAELVGPWWQENKSRFDPGRRYLAGGRCEPGYLAEVLLRGGQRQRAAAALELVMLAPGRPLFEVGARGDRQLKQLQKGW